MTQVPLRWTRLALSEQSAMVLDGDLWRLGVTVVEPDSPDDALNRLRLASAGCPPNVAIVRLSAAWVWHALEELPQRVSVSSIDRTRLVSQINGRFVTCDLRFTEGDLVQGHSRHVTSPARTATDIARYETNLGEEELVALLGRLMRVHERGFGTSEAIIERVERSRNLPYKARCLSRLNEALAFAHAINVVDRVNSTHSAEEPVQVDRVRHFENKLADGNTVMTGRDRCTQNVDVVLREHASDIAQ